MIIKGPWIVDEIVAPIINPTVLKQQNEQKGGYKKLLLTFNPVIAKSTNDDERGAR